jgi:hypothetical protein
MRYRITAVRRSGTVLAALACAGILTACAAAGSATSLAAGQTPAVKPTRPAASASASAVNVKRADLLFGISCVSQGCVAVGEYYYGDTAVRTLVERSAGEAWQLEPAADGVRGSLQAVSCTSRCVAVGSPVIAQSGTGWRVTLHASAFTAVSCASVRSCIAVGQTEAGVLVYGHWNGVTWRSGRMSRPPHRSQSVAISGVSCASADSCVAVGDYTYGAGAMPNPARFRERILVEAWNGSRWRVLPARNIAKVDELVAVACTSSARCTAVGSSRQQFPLAERWNGARWKVQPLAAPGQTGYTQLTAVSCSSAVACMAAGTYQGQPIAEEWGGGGWRLQLLPRPPADNNSAQLNGVSCVSPTECVAVGVSGNGLSYAERYAGTRWQLEITQNPA